MAELNIQIKGRNYAIACDDGQEQRVRDLASYVDEKLKAISAAGAGTNESHLLVLTAIVMADEIFDLKDNAANTNASPLDGLKISESDESDIVEAIDMMAKRINSMADNLQSV
ncbi:MAG: cell division protein ZapA [Micavibrio sp.]|nr:cell division protein ZapA [Micavibrio sp.]|tara:strand:+ start:304 stop:642 length:339 start_codon:yes stop_codon:yes gene_type:complete